MYMLWFQIFLVLKFQTSLIFIPFVSDYGNKYYTKENKN